MHRRRRSSRLNNEPKKLKRRNIIVSDDESDDESEAEHEEEESEEIDQDSEDSEEENPAPKRRRLSRSVRRSPRQNRRLNNKENDQNNQEQQEPEEAGGMAIKRISDHSEEDDDDSNESGNETNQKETDDKEEQEEEEQEQDMGAGSDQDEKDEDKKDEEDPEDDEEEESAASAADTSAFTNIREIISKAKSGEELLQILQEHLGKLVKDEEDPDQILVAGLVCSCNEHPQHFSDPLVLKFLIRLLRSKHYSSAQVSEFERRKKNINADQEKSSIKLSELICNILVDILRNTTNWPIDCVKVYLDDSLYARNWVDSKLCQTFVRNVLTMLSSDQDNGLDLNCLPLVCNRFQGPGRLNEIKEILISHLKNRVVSVLKEKKVGGDSSGSGFPSSLSSSLSLSTANISLRNLILTLSDFCALPDIRLLVAQNIVPWLQNLSVKGLAKDLLYKTIKFCTSADSMDMETVKLLMEMKLKANMWQLQMDVITQLVRRRREFLNFALKLFIARERPNNMAKGADNMKILISIFRSTRFNKEETPGADQRESKDRKKSKKNNPCKLVSLEFAYVVQEMALEYDISPVLKTIVRKLLKQISFDYVDVVSFCEGLMSDRKDVDLARFPEEFRMEWLYLMSSLVSLTLMMRSSITKGAQIHGSKKNKSFSGSTAATATSTSCIATGKRNSITSTVGSTSSQLRNSNCANDTNNTSVAALASESNNNSRYSTIGDKNDDLINVFCEVQKISMKWCLDIWPHYVGQQILQTSLFVSVVRLLLFLDLPADLQISDHEKTCFLFCKDSIPVHEYLISPILKMGGNNMMRKEECLSICEKIVYRGASLGNGGIRINNVDVVQQLFDLISDPLIKDVAYCDVHQFWRVCNLVLILGGYCCESVGQFIWSSIPTLRCVMQMVISNSWVFPPIDVQDKYLFGTFSSDASGLSITAASSQQHQQNQLLLQNKSNAMIVGLSDVAKPVPATELAIFQASDKDFQLGKKFRQCRHPDFLMDMINLDQHQHRHTSSVRSVLWIATVVCSEQETIHYLPFACICELVLLAYEHILSKQRQQTYIKEDPRVVQTLIQLAPQFIQRLRNILHGKEGSENASHILNYFINSLVSSNTTARYTSSSVLQILLGGESGEVKGEHIKTEKKGKFEWISAVRKLACYSEQIERKILSTLEEIMKIETDLEALKACLFALQLYTDTNRTVAEQFSFVETLSRFVWHRSVVAEKLYYDEEFYHCTIQTFHHALQQAIVSKLLPNEKVEVLSLRINHDNNEMDVNFSKPLIQAVISMLTFSGNIPPDLIQLLEQIVSWLFYPLNKKSDVFNLLTDQADILYNLALVQSKCILQAVVDSYMNVEMLWVVLFSSELTQHAAKLVILRLAREISANAPITEHNVVMNKLLSALKNPHSSIDNRTSSLCFFQQISVVIAHFSQLQPQCETSFDKEFYIIMNWLKKSISSSSPKTKSESLFTYNDDQQESMEIESIPTPCFSLGYIKQQVSQENDEDVIMHEVASKSVQNVPDFVRQCCLGNGDIETVLSTIEGNSSSRTMKLDLCYASFSTVFDYICECKKGNSESQMVLAYFLKYIPELCERNLQSFVMNIINVLKHMAVCDKFEHFSFLQANISRVLMNLSHQSNGSLFHQLDLLLEMAKIDHVFVYHAVIVNQEKLRISSKSFSSVLLDFLCQNFNDHPSLLKLLNRQFFLKLVIELLLKEFSFHQQHADEKMKYNRFNFFLRSFIKDSMMIAKILMILNCSKVSSACNDAVSGLISYLYFAKPCDMKFHLENFSPLWQDRVFRLEKMKRVFTNVPPSNVQTQIRTVFNASFTEIHDEEQSDSNAFLIITPHFYSSYPFFVVENLPIVYSKLREVTKIERLNTNCQQHCISSLVLIRNMASEILRLEGSFTLAMEAIYVMMSIVADLYADDCDSLMKGFVDTMCTFILKDMNSVMKTIEKQRWRQLMDNLTQLYPKMETLVTLHKWIKRPLLKGVPFSISFMGKCKPFAKIQSDLAKIDNNFTKEVVEIVKNSIQEIDSLFTRSSLFGAFFIGSLLRLLEMEKIPPVLIKSCCKCLVMVLRADYYEYAPLITNSLLKILLSNSSSQEKKKALLVHVHSFVPYFDPTVFSSLGWKLFLKKQDFANRPLIDAIKKRVVCNLSCVS